MTRREGRKSPSFCVPFLFSNESKIFQCPRFEAQFRVDSFKFHYLKWVGEKRKKKFKSLLFQSDGQEFESPLKKKKKRELPRKRKGLCVSMWITTSGAWGGSSRETHFCLALISELEAGR